MSSGYERYINKVIIVIIIKTCVVVKRTGTLFNIRRTRFILLKLL